MNEYARQGVHIVFGIVIAAAIQVLGREIALPALFLALLAGLILSDALARGYRVPLVHGIVRELERPGVLPGKGAICFVFSSVFCLFFFPVSVVVPAVLSLAVLDGVCALAGRSLGKHRIRAGKSLEGTAAGIAVTAAVLLLLVPPLLAAAASLVAGAVELLSPVDDNLVIPPVVCLVLVALS